jgi:hypothetical protein
MAICLSDESACLLRLHISKDDLSRSPKFVKYGSHYSGMAHYLLMVLIKSDSAYQIDNALPRTLLEKVRAT